MGFSGAFLEAEEFLIKSAANLAPPRGFEPAAHAAAYRERAMS